MKLLSVNVYALFNGVLFESISEGTTVSARTTKDTTNGFNE